MFEGQILYLKGLSLFKIGTTVLKKKIIEREIIEIWGGDNPQTVATSRTIHSQAVTISRKLLTMNCDLITSDIFTKDSHPLNTTKL